MKKTNIVTQAVNTLVRILTEPYYVAVATLGGVGMLALNYWLLTRVTTIADFVQMAKSGEYGPWSAAYGIAYGVLTVLFVVIFGLSLALLAWQFKHARAGRITNAGMSGLGAAGSALGAGCPVCGAFLLQLLGITAGFGVFPLKGLEFQLVGLAIVSASTLVTAKRVAPALEKGCAECEATGQAVAARPPGSRGPRVLPGLENALIVVLIVIFTTNHLLIGQVAGAMGMKRTTGGNVAGVGRFIGSLLGAKTAAAKTIIAPKLNPDGLTTTLSEWPTITDVPANPDTGDAVADAKVVMIPTGTPFYAPEGISFDDPVGALAAWGKYEDEIALTGDLEARWQNIIGTMTCDYCCGSPDRVTVINRCGCNHAKAWRSIAKYLIQNYGSEYSDDEILGELKRWRGAWYPKGSIEDYLLATGKGDVLGHETHGGAGSDARHGF